VNYLLFPKKEDRDIDFMSNLNMNEFLYILKKCFEAQSINISDIKDKILNSSIFNILKINNKSNYDSFINKVSENIFKLIKVEKSKDLNDIYSFVKTFLFNNFIENGNNIEEFQKIFANAFKGINNYDKNVEEKYLKKLAKCLNDKVGKLKNEFEFIDFNQKGIISFIALKKVIEKLKLNIKNDVLEYMIFFMKRASINDSKNINNYSLRHLNYKIFLDKISSLINSNNNIDLSNSSNLSEIEPNNFEGGFNTNITDENSLIEITNEEYNEKLTLILNSISSEIIKKSNKNTGEYINKLFEREITTDQIGHQIIELSKFVERIKNSLFIELNQIEIFCLYSRFQFNDNNKINNTELIDFKSFKNEILLYVNQLKNTKNISYDVLNEKNNNGNNAIKDINILNENDDIKTDDKEDINKQNEEYNDFEKNNFDSVI
jgi:cell division protein ZapA (FtsZ GTPase activity inhibitor)